VSPAKGKARVRTVQVGLRVPIGLHEELLRVMDEERLWARPQSFIFEAMYEKIQRIKAARRAQDQTTAGGLPDASRRL
jgi:hypothetical protein